MRGENMSEKNAFIYFSFGITRAVFEAFCANIVLPFYYFFIILKGKEFCK